MATFDTQSTTSWLWLLAGCAIHPVDNRFPALGYAGQVMSGEATRWTGAMRLLPKRSMMPVAISAPAPPGSLFDNHHASGLHYTPANRVIVNGVEAANVDRFSVDRFSVDRFSVDRFSVDRFSVDRFSVGVLRGQFFGSSHGEMVYRQSPENRYVLALAAQSSLIQGHGIVFWRDFLDPSSAPDSARAPLEPYNNLCSNIRTGLSSRTADLRTPLVVDPTNSSWKWSEGEPPPNHSCYCQESPKSCPQKGRYALASLTV
jgi:hypothetical protein